MTIKARNRQERDRIVAIAEKIVHGRIHAGELDPTDDAALKAATEQACRDAMQAYRAAEEFLF